MLVETESLTKRYGSFTALNECSISVRQGEIFGLLGPNGAGKTTLIRLLMGFLRPTSGKSQIDGLDCYRQSVDVHKIVAYLPGDARLFRRMRGRDVLKFFSAVRGSGDFERAVKLAERLDLDLRRRVGFMSTGMRQKLAVAATLAAEVSVMILDEPTANLDPNVRSEILLLLKEAQAKGCTILLSSHVLSEIEETCDRAVILRAGQLVHTQVMSDVHTRHRVTGCGIDMDAPTNLQAAVPSELKSQIDLYESIGSQVTMVVNDDLAPVLPWISSLGLKEIKIEPLGLRSVYDRFHGSDEK